MDFLKDTMSRGFLHETRKFCCFAWTSSPIVGSWVSGPLSLCFEHTLLHWSNLQAYLSSKSVWLEEAKSDSATGDQPCFWVLRPAWWVKQLPTLQKYRKGFFPNRFKTAFPQCVVGMVKMVRKMEEKRESWLCIWSSWNQQGRDCQGSACGQPRLFRHGHSGCFVACSQDGTSYWWCRRQCHYGFYWCRSEARCHHPFLLAFRQPEHL